MTHRPVLLDAVVESLAPQAGGLYVDATFGGGGYSRALLDLVPCRVVGLDRDPDAIARARELAAERPAFSFVETAFGDMVAALAAHGITAVDGIVFDLGVSSFQLDTPERGFSFRADGPLDMRMGCTGPTAAELLAEIDERDLARLLFTLGDEPQARAIAKAIAAQRRSAPLTTTGELAALVARVKGGRRGPRDPATQTFQALRMAVNDELGQLERGLEAAERLLKPEGRLVVVSFHSGEDALVKRFVNEGGARQAQASRHLPPMAQGPAPRWRWVRHGTTKPRAEEVAANPRARSARLRAAIRLSPVDDDSKEEGSPWHRAA